MSEDKSITSPQQQPLHCHNSTLSSHTHLPTISVAVSMSRSGRRATETESKPWVDWTSASQSLVHVVNVCLAGCSSDPHSTAQSSGCTNGYGKRRVTGLVRTLVQVFHLRTLNWTFIEVLIWVSINCLSSTIYLSIYYFIHWCACPLLHLLVFCLTWKIMYTDHAAAATQPTKTMAATL